MNYVDGSAIDVYMNGLPFRSFPNVSLGLEQTDIYQHQCDSNGIPRSGTFRMRSDDMIYTPNRRLQAETMRETNRQRIQLAVVLALGGHNSGHYDYGPTGSLNGLMAVWDSWQENFFSQTSNVTSLILLLDERDFLNQNFTKSKDEYLDILMIKNIGASSADCVHMNERSSMGKKHQLSNGKRLLNTNTIHHSRNSRRSVPPPRGCNSNRLEIDSGYKVYYIDVATSNNIHQKPFIIFATIHHFPKPNWAKDESEETLFIHWRPFRLNRRYPTNYGYVKMTNWYSYHMLNLKILDYFDYIAKLDNDVSFVAPFPEPNLPLKMVTNSAKMLITQTKWYNDDNRIVQGTRSCVESYIDEESKLCSKTAVTNPNHPITTTTIKSSSSTNKKIPIDDVLWLKGSGPSVLWEGDLNLTARAHFLVVWLGLYTAPETIAMAKYWNDWHPRGMWDYRWGDQQWWPKPIAVYGGANISQEILVYEEINTDNEKYLVHKLWPRFGTVKECRYFNYSGTTRNERDSMYNISAIKQSKWRPF